MAHFAKVENGLVVDVLVVADENEEAGEDFLHSLGLEGRWVQTSYNTWGNVHSEGKTPLRYNYAGVGFIYDEELDAFYPPKPFESWVLDENCVWQAPVPRPSDAAMWDEESLSWVEPSV